MDWKNFENSVRNKTSQTYDIIIKNMDLYDLKKYILLIENRDYIHFFGKFDTEEQKNSRKESIEIY